MKLTAAQSAILTELLDQLGPGLPTPTIWWSARFDYMVYSLVDELTTMEYVNTEISLLKKCDKKIVGVEIRNVRAIVDSLLLDEEMRELLLDRAETLEIDLTQEISDDDVVDMQPGKMRAIIDALLLNDEIRAMLLHRAEKLGINLTEAAKDTEQS
jgi:hypothetical protein